MLVYLFKGELVKIRTGEFVGEGWFNPGLDGGWGTITRNLLEFFYQSSEQVSTSSFWANQSRFG